MGQGAEQVQDIGPFEADGHIFTSNDGGWMAEGSAVQSTAHSIDCRRQAQARGGEQVLWAILPGILP